jgi:hypothetical protein
MIGDTRQFRIVVWRPLKNKRNLMVLALGQGGSADDDQDQAGYEFHEQVYAWEPRGIDIWGRFKSSSDTQSVRKLLLDAFNPSPAAPVDRRSISKLKLVLDALAGTLASTDPLEWADSEDPIDLNQPELLNKRANTIAVLYNHLCWIYEVFRDVPGASVSVR